MLVVKQDAYGHGAVGIAHHALRCGIGALGVGSTGEALELRQAGLRAPILILGTVVEEEWTACLRHDIEVGLHASERCKALQELAHRMGLRARVHVNVDTGMGRLGVPPEVALDLLKAVHGASNLDMAGLMTHLSAPDGAHCPSAQQQLSRFHGLIDQARALDLPTGWIHALNSAGLFTGLRESMPLPADRNACSPIHASGETVRIGIAAYGALPRSLSAPANLDQVMSVRSRIVFMKDVPQGTPVGYGSLWRAPRSTRIATLPIGYGHGLPRNLHDWDVLIGGRRAPIVGRISMDYTTVDVGHLEGVHVGQTVTILGRDAAGPSQSGLSPAPASEADPELRLEELAQTMGTIPHELTCALGRLPRIYAGESHPYLPSQAGPTPPSIGREPAEAPSAGQGLRLTQAPASNTPGNPSL